MKQALQSALELKQIDILLQVLVAIPHISLFLSECDAILLLSLAQQLSVDLALHTPQEVL